MNNVVPGAVEYPGAHAWYAAGVVRRLAMVVWHYTVGRNSLDLIANRGLAAFLISPDGTIWQCAPWDAVCYTQCEFNGRVCGIEVESLDGSITEAQIASLGYLTTYLLLAGAVPFVFYDGPRLPTDSDYMGVTNHRNLIHRVCDMHSDGFDRWVWDAAMTPPAPEPDKPKGGRMEPALWVDDWGAVFVYDGNSHTKTWVRSEPMLHSIINVWTLLRAQGRPAGNPEVVDNATTHEILAGAVLVGPDPWAAA